MNKLVLALTTASLLALTACGGGGDEDAPVQVNQPTNPSGGGTGGTAASTIGNAFKFSGTTKQDAKFASKESDAFTIIVDGKSIVTKYPGISAAEMEMQTNSYNGDNVKRILNTTAYATYGLLRDTNNNGVDYVVYQGTPTSDKELPTQDGVKYAGKAYVLDTQRDKWYKGTSNFTVNFAQKNLTGTLSGLKDVDSSATISNITLGADISGNGFKRTASGVTTEGKFYGANAAEMAGAFVDTNKNLSGAFGGKKQ